MKIFSISGLKGSGKSTVANELFRQGYERRSFAGPMKDAVAALYGWDRELLDELAYKEAALDEPVVWDSTTAAFLSGWFHLPVGALTQETRTYRTRREALQHIGTEVLRGYRDDFHVNLFEQSLHPNGLYAMDDARFPNELASLGNVGAEQVWVERPGLTADGHASENSISKDDFEQVLHNDGTLEEFQAAAHAWLAERGAYDQENT